MTDNAENIRYSDILKSEVNLNDEKAVTRQWTNVLSMSKEEKKKAAEDVLLQPYMALVYKTNGIEPCDVKDFIAHVAQYPRLCESIVFNNSLVFNNQKGNSVDANGDGVSDGDNTKIDSVEEMCNVARELSERFSGMMKPFAQKKAAERAPKAPEPNKLQKALKQAGKLLKGFLEVGRVTVIGMGVVTATYMGYEGYEAMKDNTDNKTKTGKNTNIQDNTQDKNITYTAWAKNSRTR